MLNPSIALLAWPLVALWLFARLPIERAIIWSVLLSFLFLPSSFAIDPPALPPLDKQSLPNLVLLAIVFFKASAFRILPAYWPAKILILLLIAGAAGTILTNSDTILIADLVLPGLTPYDALSGIVQTFLVIMPFLIGWQFLASPESHREFLKAIFAVGMAYSLMMLFEVRMSPQLHTWVYGYFPHSFAQQVRGDGFRPVVFLRHGLWNAFFAVTVVLTAAALWRDKRQSGDAGKARPLLAATGYMFVVLILCKSLGSLLYGIVFLPVILFLKTRTQTRVAAVLVLIALTYPVLRGAHLVPTDTFLEWAGSVSEQRQQSLETRFVNEDRLLEHAETRPVFGWGRWGRNRVFDPETGRDISITDGYWVIIIGSSGWAGYLATFGILGLPVLLLWRRRRQSGADIPPATGALALLVGINMIELLPNSTLMPWTWLMAGALLGYATQEQAASPETVAAVETPPPRRTVI